MKLIKAALASIALVSVSACVAVPVAPPYAYDHGYYYAPAPYYYGPSVSIGIFRGSRFRHR